MREDPDREGLLYAGTEFGMFISFDNGAHWQSFQLNLPSVPITDIKVHHKDLVVATQGRAFWILDNLSALHQITPQIDVRRGALVQAARRLPDARSSALGPTIEYYLPAAPAGPVTIEILDASGCRGEHLQQRSAGRRAGRPRRTRRQGWRRRRRGSGRSGRADGGGPTSGRGERQPSGA